MPSYKHKKLAEIIARLDILPSDPKAYAEWINADAHLTFLQENARADEVVVYASGEYSFVHSLVVENDRLSPPNQSDLLHWSSNPFGSAASYVYGGGRDDVWIERTLSSTGTDTLEGALQLVFGRTFEGWTGAGRDYFEVTQEYTHFTGIHWRPEQHAYCRFDENGDLEPVVSATNRADKGSDVSLVTFEWEPLEQYLAVCKASLVRMFDFMLLKRDSFTRWSDNPEEVVVFGDDFFFRRKNDGNAAYTRGVQIVRPRRALEDIYADIKNGRLHHSKKQALEFLAHDWRNDRIIRISTDPAATTNYFLAANNALPFELSPAFFRPEVLSKYKTDRDKYTLGERDITCRTAWYLEGFDVNEAGQVHAYICDLRTLPHAEQLHWLSFNEAPKAGISKRAIVNDFEGKFCDLPNPPRRVLSIIQRWSEGKVLWWTLRDRKLLNQVNTPLTTSRDEWAQAFLDLSHLVVEGFLTDAIRARLDEERVAYTKEERSIVLIEKLLNKDGNSNQRLEGLRTVQTLRNKAKGHAGGHEAEELAQNALAEHETLGNHFRHICQLVAGDLEKIESAFAAATPGEPE